MLKKMITLPLILLLTIVLAQSCDTTEPPDDNLKPGRRDYTWEIDTLNIPFTYLHRIWGSSPTDIWAVGPGGDLDKTIYHFDGEKWSNDGVSRPISPYSIWGFASNDVWIGGIGGVIWRFNGVKWSESFILDNTNINLSAIMDIYGETSNDVYAVGFIDSADVRKGLILHYNGTEWTRRSIKNTICNFTRIKRGLITSSNYFIRGLVESDTVDDTTKIFMLENNSLIQLYSAVNIKKNTNFIQNIGNEMVFVIGYTLNRFSDNNFKKFYDINEDNFGIQVFGKNINNTFVRMEDGIAHFNGIDIQYLTKTNDNIPSEAIVFDKNVTSGNNLIYRGTLKE